MDQSERTARCYCGQLRFTVVGEPALTWLCHCTDCQRRTGTTHQLTAWFRHEQVTGRSGEFKVFERAVRKGVVQAEFCADCGTTVSWSNTNMPHAKGFAAGCFADPQLPAPRIEFFTCRRHHWMNPVEGAAQFETGIAEDYEPGAGPTPVQG